MITVLKTALAAPDFMINQEWSIRRLWDIAKTRSEKNRPDLPLLAVFLNRGVISYNESAGQTHKPGLDLSPYQVVYPGDFVLNNQQAWRGSVGVSAHHGIISPAYVVLSLRDCLTPRYANYLFQSKIMVNQYVTSSKGVGDIQRDIYVPWLKNIKVPIPQTDQQLAIVRFLDWAIGRLDRTIRAKKKVIALLDEQKQAIIHRAVTRSLDSTVPLKLSTISWLDEIPSHWKELRSKYLFREVDDRSASGMERHLSMSQKHGLIPASQIEEKRLVSVTYKGAKLCRQGDLVLNRLKAHLGVFALAKESGLVSSDYTVLRPIIEMDARYFEAIYRTPACRVELRARAKGIVQGFWRLYTNDFYDIRVPVPPIQEQRQLMNHLETKLSGLSMTISRLEHEIDLLIEYRMGLICEVVTGKLDICEVAEHLPIESQEAIVNDNSTEMKEPSADPDNDEEVAET